LHIGHFLELLNHGSDALGVCAEALVPARHARHRCWIEADHTLRLLVRSSGTAIRRSWVIYTLRLFFCSGGTAIRRRWVIYVTPHVRSELIPAGSRVVAEGAGKRVLPRVRALSSHVS
jgi:hypothetical protein